MTVTQVLQFHICIDKLRTYKKKRSKGALRKLVWRRVQLPLESKFMDMNIIVQDVMGWTVPKGQKVEHRFEDTDYAFLKDDMKLTSYFDAEDKICCYKWDSAETATDHVIAFEGIVDADPKAKYPKITEGDNNNPGAEDPFMLEAVGFRPLPSKPLEAK
eukprot:Nk52_evm4s215 gene=Nk52_evmTU4s215